MSLRLAESRFLGTQVFEPGALAADSDPVSRGIAQPIPHGGEAGALRHIPPGHCFETNTLFQMSVVIIG